MAENIKSVSKTLNGRVESPLADELLKLLRKSYY